MVGGYFVDPREGLTAYDIRFARDPGSGQQFYNAWHIRTDEYVGAGLSAKEISDRCDEHREKVSRGKSEAA